MGGQKDRMEKRKTWWSDDQAAAKATVHGSSGNRPNPTATIRGDEVDREGEDCS